MQGTLIIREVENGFVAEIYTKPNGSIPTVLVAKAASEVAAIAEDWSQAIEDSGPRTEGDWTFIPAEGITCGREKK